MDLERKYWKAIKGRNASVATSLSDDPCVVVGAQGVGEVDQKTLAGMMEGAPWELTHFELGDVHVRPVADGVVVVAYKVNEQLIVDGEDVELEAYDSSVWVKRNGSWVCALHTESPAGDPFGRN
jgi:uncharacterized protein DUF4440